MTTPPPVKKPTIHDLALLAGTSASTVSAVLNGSWEKRRISKRLADHVSQIAEEQGYALNMQARALRRSRSGMVGMILPLHDNRYFSSIAQLFEDMARARGLFPIVTCTRRDPRLELEAARGLLAYQVEYLVSTGATDPDRITRLCTKAGVPTYNLDLPGGLAPSVISDNFAGALALTHDILARCDQAGHGGQSLLFVGGRGSDHNTRERLRGFRTAHEQLGLRVDDSAILTCGYAAARVSEALAARHGAGASLMPGMFVNSTIALEGVMRWIRAGRDPQLAALKLGCFDWDPFAEMISDDIVMVRQDVEAMLAALFALIDAGNDVPTDAPINPAIEAGRSQIRRIEIPPIALGKMASLLRD